MYFFTIFIVNVFALFHLFFFVQRLCHVEVFTAFVLHNSILYCYFLTYYVHCDYFILLLLLLLLLLLVLLSS